MLVLGRKIGKQIKIGDNIFLTIVNINRGIVRIGIDAPQDVNIARVELLDEPLPPGVGGKRRRSDA